MRQGMSPLLSKSGFVRPARAAQVGVLGLMAILVIGACAASGDKGSLEAARTAIASDPDLEIVATDDRAGIITVRVKSTGQLAVVNASDIKEGKVLVIKPAEAASAGEKPPPMASERTSPDAGAVTAQGSRGGPGQTDPGGVTIRGGRGSVTTSRGDRASVRADPEGATISGGTTVKVGPGGVTISEGEGAVTVSAPGAQVSVGGRPKSRPAGKRLRTEPVSCGPAQEVRVANVYLEVPEDGVIAEGGCDLEIVDSEIVAGGWGVVAQGGANVVIRNSVIEGKTGALQAQAGADVAAGTPSGRTRPELDLCSLRGRS